MPRTTTDPQREVTDSTVLIAVRKDQLEVWKHRPWSAFVAAAESGELVRGVFADRFKADLAWFRKGGKSWPPDTAILYQKNFSE